MTQIPQARLVDRQALEQNRQRRIDPAALFLHQLAIDIIHESLEIVNRELISQTIVTGFHRIWGQSFPDAQFVEDGELLNFPKGEQDLVVHGLGLHWAEDPVGQLIQCRHALKPDGLFLAVLFGGQTLHELRVCLAEAESRLSGGLSPRVLPMAEIRDLGGLLQRAGFALPVSESYRQSVRYETPLHLMRDLRAMGETNALANRSRRFLRRDVLQLACEIYQDAFSDADGRITATFELICLTGWAPAASQPQPLRPGSAEARLADVLGAKETKLPGGGEN